MGGDDGGLDHVLHVLQHRHDFPPGGNVQIGGGLVQQQDAGIQGDADGQAGPAHLPAGHEAAVPVLQLRQPEPLQQLRGAPLPLRDVPYLHGVGDVGADGVLDEHLLRVLIHQGDLPGQILGLFVPNGLPEEGNCAGIGLQQTHHQLHEGGLARPVGADEGHLFPFPYVQVQAVEHGVGLPLYRAVGQRYVLEGDCALSVWDSWRRTFPGDIMQSGEGGFSSLHGGGQGDVRRKTACPPQPVGRLGHLGRENVAFLQLLHPLEGVLRGQHPADLAVLHEHHMLAVVGDVLGVVLDDDDGLTLVLIQIPENLVDPVGVHGVQLGDGLVQDQNVRLEGHRAGQGQQVGLTAGELPDIFLLPALQTALPQSSPAPRQVVGEGVVQAGIGGVVQHGGPDDLVFKVLIYIAHLLGQDAHVALPGVKPLHPHASLHGPRDKVGDQAVEGLTQSGLPAAVVANDRQEVPFLDLKGDLFQGGLRGAWVGIGQAVDLNRVHVSSPRPFSRRSF